MNPLYQRYDYARRQYEAKKDYFPEFRRDYARVIHSASFRRLQGKTQIFPGFESDFFRNRLTHSLEVAQVAKSITLMLNQKYNLNIDDNLVETAALCHDIGHPPFGHNGERALHSKMLEAGGFEGNAQTLRLVAKTEKKIKAHNAFQTDENEHGRLGLNMTYRTMAALLKYDKVIPDYIVNLSDLPQKGYYNLEENIVSDIKSHVLADFSSDSIPNQSFKTIECQIMDLADDIAYSTYDIEDAFKSGFLDPMSMVCAEDSLLAKVSEELNIREGIYLSICEIRTILMDVFRHELDFENGHYRNNYQKSRQLANSGYLRTRLTSFLVHDCIANIECIYNNQCPPLSQVYLTDKMRAQVETLKLFVYNVVISAPKMNIIRYRGREIIRDLFDLLLASKPDNSLLPQDVAEIFYSYDPQQEAQRKRIIADFISSMTDRYAVELYNQFRSDASQTIFKPL